MCDKKEEIKDISWEADSEIAVVQKGGHRVVQRAVESPVYQISGDGAYQEALEYAKQVTGDWSIQKAEYKAKQKAEGYAVQISEGGSFQEAGYYAIQRTTYDSVQVAGESSIQYGESSVRQKAGRVAVQIGGVEVEQFAGDHSVQIADEDSFQSAGEGSVSIVYGKKARCRHQGLVLQVLIFHDSLELETVILTKLINDDKEHLLEAVKENGKWVLKDTIIE